MTLSIAIICVVTTLLHISFSTIYSEKSKDTWAILFLEIEQKSQSISQHINSVFTNKENIDQTYILKRHGNTFQSIKGNLPKIIEAQSLGISNQKYQFQFTKFAGKNYIAKRLDAFQVQDITESPTSKGIYYALVPISYPDLGLRSQRRLSDGYKYIITDSGQLIFSNSDSITPINFVNRHLVKSLSQSDINQGRTRFVNKNGEKSFGFFYGIPSTNATILFELREQDIFLPIDNLLYKFIGIFSLIGILSIIAMQIPLTILLNPLKNLANMTRDISRGKFDLTMATQGIGEVKVLSQSFYDMTKSLIVRDRAIHDLMKEQKEKIRLDGELQITRHVQKNFLPDLASYETKHLAISSIYLPAEEAAGDWFSYYHDEHHGETIISIADVSGHGAGSAMFTAIISGVFEHFKNKANGYFSLEDFMQSLNNVICNLGKNQWLSTMICFRILDTEDQIEVVCAGAVPPLLYSKSSDKIKSILLPSSLLGEGETFTLNKSKLNLEKDDSILVFTDGVIEAKNTHQKDFTSRKVRKIFKDIAHHKPNIYLNKMLTHLEDHMKGEKPHDDICIVGIKRL